MHSFACLLKKRVKSHHKLKHAAQHWIRKQQAQLDWFFLVELPLRMKFQNISTLRITTSNVRCIHYRGLHYRALKLQRNVRFIHSYHYKGLYTLLSFLNLLYTLLSFLNHYFLAKESRYFKLSLQRTKIIENIKRGLQATQL